MSERRNFLTIKEAGIYAGYLAATLGMIHGLEVTGALESAKDICEKLMNGGSMATGFLIGCAENVVAMGITLGKLSGGAELAGVGGGEVRADGVLVRKSTCGDIRILRDTQNSVELGSGYMQGAFLRHLILAGVADQTIGNEMLTGYLLGRVAPAAAVSTLSHTFKSVVAWFTQATIEVEEPHAQMCGWTATEGWGRFALKFLHAPDSVLDGVNFVDRVLQLPVQALEQTVLVPLSGGKFIRVPGAYSEMSGKH